MFLRCKSRYKKPAEDKEFIIVFIEPVTASWHHSWLGVGVLSIWTWKMRCLTRLWLCSTAWFCGSLQVPWCLVVWCPTSLSTETSAGPRMQRGSRPMCAWSSWWQTSSGYSLGNICPLCCMLTNLYSKICNVNTVLIISQSIYLMEQELGCFKSHLDILRYSAYRKPSSIPL